MLHMYTLRVYTTLLVVGVMLLKVRPFPTRCTVLRISDFVPYMPHGLLHSVYEVTAMLSETDSTGDTLRATRVMGDGYAMQVTASQHVLVVWSVAAVMSRIYMLCSHGIQVTYKRRYHDMHEM